MLLLDFLPLFLAYSSSNALACTRGATRLVELVITYTEKQNAFVDTETGYIELEVGVGRGHLYTELSVDKRNVSNLMPRKAKLGRDPKFKKRCIVIHAYIHIYAY